MRVVTTVTKKRLNWLPPASARFCRPIQASESPGTPGKEPRSPLQTAHSLRTEARATNFRQSPVFASCRNLTLVRHVIEFSVRSSHPLLRHKTQAFSLPCWAAFIRIGDRRPFLFLGCDRHRSRERGIDLKQPPRRAARAGSGQTVACQFDSQNSDGRFAIWVACAIRGSQRNRATSNSSTIPRNKPSPALSRIRKFAAGCDEQAWKSMVHHPPKVKPNRCSRPSWRSCGACRLIEVGSHQVF